MATNFWAARAKFFGHLGIELADGVSFDSLAADPTITATDAVANSIGVFSGGFYVKQDAGSTTNWVLVADNAALLAHINSLTAHPSENITFDNVVSGLVATDVKAALDEIDAKTDAHIASLTAHNANAIVFNNVASGLVAVDVQAAIDEVEARVDSLELPIVINTTEVVTTEATITTAAFFHNIRLTPVSAVTLSVTPFGIVDTLFTDGQTVTLIGTDDTNSVTIVNNDAAFGCVLNGNVELIKYAVVVLRYDATFQRFIEVTRNV